MQPKETDEEFGKELFERRFFVMSMDLACCALDYKESKRCLESPVIRQKCSFDLVRTTRKWILRSESATGHFILSGSKEAYFKQMSELDGNLAENGE